MSGLSRGRAALCLDTTAQRIHQIDDFRRSVLGGSLYLLARLLFLKQFL
jgi:hypothetical protein